MRTSRCSRSPESSKSPILDSIELPDPRHALRLYDQMRRRGIAPSSFALVAALKACGLLGDPDKGRQIFAEAVEEGLVDRIGRNDQGSVVVLNTLIGMLARCGSMHDARIALESWTHRNVVSWTALIAGYVEQRLESQALECFAAMQQRDEIAPNAFTFSSALKACSNIHALDDGRKIHVQVIQTGAADRCLSIGNALISMYARCGCILEAQHVFDGLGLPDTISWTALMVGYSEHGCEDLSLALFDDMESKCIGFDAFAFACALKACGNLAALEKGRRIHLRIVLEDMEDELSVANSLMGMYAKCGSLLEAQNVFDEIRAPNAVSWAALATAYTDHGSSVDTLKLFRSMQHKGITPNTVVFFCALRACGVLADPETGGEMHSAVIKLGFKEDLMMSSTLIDMYAKCGLLLDARVIFDKLESRNVVAWTALIGGYSDHGPYLEALMCNERMQGEGIAPSIATYVCVLKACGNIGAIDNGIRLHFEIVHKGMEGDQSICNSLLCMYIKCGFLSRARELFLATCFPQNIASWSAMIQGYGAHHDSHMVLSCFEEMQRQGIRPNAITFTCLLDACSHANLIAPAWVYFQSMEEEYGISPTMEHYTCVVDVLARSGHLHDAVKFLEMFQHSASERTWAALLSACKAHCQTTIGAKCFENIMQAESVVGK